MSNRKQLRKTIKRELSMALNERTRKTKQKKHKSPEHELFAEIDEEMHKLRHHEDY